MRETRVSLPELALIAGTRVALGAGLGLLLGDRLPPDQRRGVGWALLLLGAATTIPLAFEVLGKRDLSAVAEPTGNGTPFGSERRSGQRTAAART